MLLHGPRELLELRASKKERQESYVWVRHMPQGRRHCREGTERKEDPAGVLAGRQRLALGIPSLLKMLTI